MTVAREVEPLMPRTRQEAAKIAQVCAGHAEIGRIGDRQRIELGGLARKAGHIHVELKSQLITSDADGDPIASYEFTDNGASGGYIVVNNVVQPVQTAIVISAADINGAYYVAAGPSPARKQSACASPTDSRGATRKPSP